MDELGKNGCYDDNCSSVLKIQDAKDVIGCTIPSRVPESVGVDGGCEYPFWPAPVLELIPAFFFRAVLYSGKWGRFLSPAGQGHHDNSMFEFLEALRSSTLFLPPVAAENGPV